MSEVKKSFVLKKTCAGSVFTIVSPMSNPNVTRIIDLTDRVPQQVLPEDWALGFIMDQGNYSLYKNGYVTFDKNEELAKLAAETGVLFDDFGFTPAKEDQTSTILAILKTGVRIKIQEAINTYGKDKVRDVAAYNIDNLTTAVVKTLENMLNTQLTID